MKHIQRIHRGLYAIGLGPLIGWVILLLTTTGRRTGRQHVTPLQYERIGPDYYVGSARGLQADWVRNIQKNPLVEVRVGSKHFKGTAEVVCDSQRGADFLELRLERHPLMIGLIMQKAHGLPRRPSRRQLEDLAADEAFVIIHPSGFRGNKS